MQKKTAAADFATTVYLMIHIFLKSHFLTDIPIPIHFILLNIMEQNSIQFKPFIQPAHIACGKCRLGKAQKHFLCLTGRSTL